MKRLITAASMIVIGLSCMGFAPSPHAHSFFPSWWYVAGVGLAGGGILFAALIGLAALFKAPPGYGMKD